MTHIGIDARLLYYRPLGGTSTYIRQLAAALERIDTRNQYTLFQSRKANMPVAKRFSERKLWTPPHHRLERLALSVELWCCRLDVLHSPDFIPPLRGARRHVITVHDLTFLHYPNQKDAQSRRYYNDQIEMAVRHADHILTVSEASKQDLITMLSVPAEKITVHLHGIDDRFKELPADILADWRQQLVLPQRYILFVGTLEPRKNIPALLDAYLALPGGLQDEFPLLLVGRPGWLFDETMQHITKLQAQGSQIIIRSDIDDDMLPAVYNLATVFVLPSWYEGFGMPALEAMACGTPVIVSNVSALPEVVGACGLQIDPRDPAALAEALERALTDLAWQSHARQAGLRHAQEFTWERSAQIALSVYESVI